jgi:hypothetical protein
MWQGQKGRYWLRDLPERDAATVLMEYREFFILRSTPGCAVRSVLVFFSSNRMKSVVPGNDHERDAGRVEPAGRFGHGRTGPGPGPDHIKKVARVDKHVGLLPDNNICH